MSIYKKIFTGVLSGTLLFAVSQSVHADEKLNNLDKMFLMKVSQGNLSEIQTSRLALRKSQNKKVRLIAVMLIKDHGTAQRDLLAVARQKRVSVPGQPDVPHKMMYAKLASLSGAAFDKAYMTGQVRDHDKTVALFNKEMQNGSETHVHSFAAKYLPAIESHTEMIHNVASNLGITVTAPRQSAMIGSRM